MSALLTQIGTVLSAAIGWVGSVVSSMFGSSGQLADLVPFLAIGMGLGILGLGVKYVRSFVQIG